MEICKAWWTFRYFIGEKGLYLKIRRVSTGFRWLFLLFLDGVTRVIDILHPADWSNPNTYLSNIQV